MEVDSQREFAHALCQTAQEYGEEYVCRIATHLEDGIVDQCNDQLSLEEIENGVDAICISLQRSWLRRVFNCQWQIEEDLLRLPARSAKDKERLMRMAVEASVLEPQLGEKDEDDPPTEEELHELHCKLQEAQDANRRRREENERLRRYTSLFATLSQRLSTWNVVQGPFDALAKNLNELKAQVNHLSSHPNVREHAKAPWYSHTDAYSDEVPKPQDTLGRFDLAQSWMHSRGAAEARQMLTRF
mmetsp:Transcript_143785/g.250990  ORF Transcript_143785/g.250990 Transcript_143785/m.250990 type:complete len:244 (-) Transcript_143785:709-1440(-)